VRYRRAGSEFFGAGTTVALADGYVTTLPGRVSTAKAIALAEQERDRADRGVFDVERFVEEDA